MTLQSLNTNTLTSQLRASDVMYSDEQLEDILNKLNSTSAKSITTTTVGASVLQPGYYNKFVQEAQRQQTLLYDARLVTMNSEVQNIDRTGFDNSIMQPATELTAVTSSDPSFHQEQLIAQKFIADLQVSDDMLDINIEQQGYTNTLLQMTSGRWGADWETLATLSNKSYTTTTDPLLKSSNGWIKKCNTKLYGSGTGKDFDPAATNNPISLMMKKMIKSYSSNALFGGRQNLRFYLDSDLFDDYIDEVGERPTATGDDATGNDVARPYKGIVVKEAPVLNMAKSIPEIGQTCMLMNPQNMVYGVFKNMTMEPYRQPRIGATNYVFTAKMDQGFENPNIGVVAHTSIAKPSG